MGEEDLLARSLLLGNTSSSAAQHCHVASVQHGVCGIFFSCHFSYFFLRGSIGAGRFTFALVIIVFPFFFAIVSTGWVLLISMSIHT